MTLAMGWDEWAAHDAVALAARVRQGDVTAAELAAQVAAGVARVNPQLHAVIELFDDAVADPVGAGAHADGFFAGVPFLMKDLGPTMAGRLLWNARWNESLFVTSCAERLLAAPGAHSEDEIFHRIAADLADGADAGDGWLSFRIVLLSQQPDAIDREIAFVAPPRRLSDIPVR